MATVAEQLAARKAKATKPQDAEKPTEAVAETPKTTGKKTYTPEEQAQRAADKEARKKAAFDKLREMSDAKKAARAAELERDLKAAKRLLMPNGKAGRIMYSTRASYYGVKCRVLDVELTQGRILVSVQCISTKGGADLPEDKYYERRFSTQFLQEEPPDEEYVPRRNGKRKERFDRRKAKAAKKQAAATSEEAEADLELADDAEDADLEPEDEEKDDLLDEADEDEDSDEDEDEEEDEDLDLEEDDDDEDSPTGSADEDSWG